MQAPDHDAGTAPVLLYDGLCGMCNGAVRLVLRLEAEPLIRFAALNGSYATSIFSRHPELASEDTIVFITTTTDGREIVRVRSDAALDVLRHLRGGRIVANALSMIPRSLRDSAYRLVARNRARISGRYEACPIPAPAVRARFLS